MMSHVAVELEKRNANFLLILNGLLILICEEEEKNLHC